MLSLRDRRVVLEVANINEVADMWLTSLYKNDIQAYGKPFKYLKQISKTDLR